MSRWPLVLVLCAALAGCGRGDDERAVSAVTARLLTASDADDGDVVCSLLAEDTAKALADDAGELCEDAARSLDLTTATVRHAQVFGVSAKVDLSDGSSAFLDLTPDGWRVAAAGCLPIGAEQPYECEVDA